MLQDAVDDKYPDRLEDFFEAVAARATITRETASGTFYGFLRSQRALPAAHADAYVDLTGVSRSVLADIDALRSGRRGARSPDRLAQLEALVAELRGVVVQLADDQGVDVPDVLREGSA